MSSWPSTGASCGRDALEEDDASPALAHLNDADRRSVLALIADFRKELDRRTIGPRGRQVLDQLMPHLLSEICSRARCAAASGADHAAVDRDRHPHHLS